MKNYLSQMQFIMKAIKIIIILVIIYCVILKNNMAFAEELKMSYEEEVMIDVQQAVHKRLIRFINQEDFKSYYINKYLWFYNNIPAINEQDVINFIKTTSWHDIIEKVNHETFLSDITKEFAKYCEELTKERCSNYLQKRAQAYTDALNDCNNIIKETGLFIKNNIYLVGWFCACLIVYKMYHDPSILNSIYHTLENSTSDLSKTYMQRLLELIPQLKPYITMDNSAIEINNIAGYVFTPGAKLELQSTVETAVTNRNTNVIIIGSLICIGLFIGSLTYFM